MSVMHIQSEFIQNRVKEKKIRETRTKTYTYMFVFINNPRFAEFLPLIYPPELEIKEITDTASSISFLTIVINSVLKFMINGMTSILKS